MRKKRKPTAAENKLNALLGLTTKAEEVKSSSIGKFYGVSEAEIQDFRAAQGFIYFLQAPELFKPSICKYCKEPFLVSRLFVACCSYHCIRKDLERRGFRWEKGHIIEDVILDPQVYNGNEPIWIREPQLSKALEVLTNLLEKDTNSIASQESTPQETVLPEPSTLSTPPVTETSSSPSSTTPPQISTKTSLVKSGSKRKISFGN